VFDKSLDELKVNNDIHEAIIEELGRHLVILLQATLKIAAMYDANNNRYLEQSDKLRAVLRKIFDEETDFTLTIKGGYMYINETRMKVERDCENAMNYFLDHWPKLGMSGLTITSNLDPRELDRFIFFIKDFQPEEKPEENFDNIKQRLIERGIENIAPTRLVEEELEIDPDEAKAIRAKARKTFFKAMAVVQDTAEKATSQEKINIARSKRAVQNLIDVIIQDESALLEMTALQSFDDYTYVHSVNVCVLSLVLGYHLGLDRKTISDLGVGALIHDIGKTSLPVELINKPGKFDEYDWEQMRKHPTFGVKFIFKTRKVDETTAKAATAVFEHHITYDGMGYPELLQKRKPKLFARIVAIADNYNAMVSGRVYQKKRLTPDEIITNMVNRAGKSFDSLLLKVFINAIGIYPVGAVVALSSKEVGIIAKTNPENPEQPKVKVVGNENGLYDLGNVKVVDLSEDTDLKVTKLVDGDKYDINNANYLEIF
jgi:HD-GYP domain-containing protein (c-di-GMP phosphodiesterase class II)